MNRAGSTLIVAMAIRRTSSRSTTSSSSPATTSSRSSPPSRPSDEAIERYYASKGPIVDERDGRASTTPRSSIVEDGDDDVDVVDLEKSAERGAGRQAREPDPARRHQEGRVATSTSSPTRRSFRVRYRIDGVLYEVMKPPLKLQERDHLAPQDHGRARHRRAPPAAGRPHQAEARQAARRWTSASPSCPTLFGEKVVLRLLDKANLQLDMTKLGFEENAARRLPGGDRPALRHGARHRPDRLGQDDHALLGALRAQQDRPRTSRTAEDPVEFNLAGINQVQMHEDIGLNFAAALRSFLRQDPDIIMVGEIRDFETAEIAVKAALTGHLVLSTLHTNDAPVAPSPACSTWASSRSWSPPSVNLIVAQRLARRICADCKAAGRRSTPQALLDAGFADRGDRAASQAYDGARLQELQRHRLQGPRRALRGDAADDGPAEGARPAAAPRRPRSSARRSAAACGRCACSALNKVLRGRHDARRGRPRHARRTTV